MSLNVKDAEVHRLAQAIAMKESLRERYERLQRSRTKASVDELLATADRAAAHVKRPYMDHAELLYDEHGLPK